MERSSAKQVLFLNYQKHLKLREKTEALELKAEATRELFT